jgi:hypothetical protein
MLRFKFSSCLDLDRVLVLGRPTGRSKASYINDNFLTGKNHAIYGGVLKKIANF